MARLAQLVASVAATLAVGASASGDQSVLTSEIGRLNNQSLLWGPYKPNLYFGVRPRLPDGLWTGLLWTKVDRFEDVAAGTQSSGIRNTAPFMRTDRVYQAFDIHVSKAKTFTATAGTSMMHETAAFRPFTTRATRLTSRHRLSRHRAETTEAAGLLASRELCAMMRPRTLRLCYSTTLPKMGRVS